LKCHPQDNYLVDGISLGERVNMQVNLVTQQKRLFALCLFVLATSACSASNVAQHIFNSPNQRRFAIGRSFHPTTGQSRVSEPRVIDFPYVNSDMSIEFAGFLDVKTESSENLDEQFALIGMVNYRQVPIRVDKKSDLVHYITLRPEKMARFDIALELPNKEQRNKVTLLMFRAAGAKNNERDAAEMTVHADEFDAVVGAAHLYPIVPPATLNGMLVSNSSGQPFVGIFANFDANSFFMTTEREVTAGSSITLFAHIGHDDQPTSSFLVLTFLDYEQVSSNSTKNTFISGKVERNTRVSLPISLDLPAQTSEHMLQLVYVTRPFGSDEIIRSGASAIDSTTIGWSNRIRLKVTP
jgi:hypothetical protein